MSGTLTSPSPSSSPQLCVQLHSPFIPASNSFDAPVPVFVKASVSNTAKSPLTLLKWGSPLDPRANILGVFTIIDTETHEPVTIDEIKFRRILPPPLEDFVQIAPGEDVEVSVTIPRAPLVAGRRYTIQAKGWWQAVWEVPLVDVPIRDLEELTGALRGEFKSNIVSIET
ncbi:hypothetical protein BJY01DRAFT_208468 [Aspergillus pseudoustus]|uniref:Uncharacterized protein n=1 Tax=Aspergillus pseudoustus TaxID=1810923 RepID=A0ABR4KIJ7_9EURO